jgi:hypothetical protein
MKWIGQIFGFIVTFPETLKDWKTATRETLIEFGLWWRKLTTSKAKLYVELSSELETSEEAEIVAKQELSESQRLEKECLAKAKELHSQEMAISPRIRLTPLKKDREVLQQEQSRLRAEKKVAWKAHKQADRESSRLMVRYHDLRWSTLMLNTMLEVGNGKPKEKPKKLLNARS